MNLFIDLSDTLMQLAGALVTPFIVAVAFNNQQKTLDVLGRYILQKVFDGINWFGQVGLII